MDKHVKIAVVGAGLAGLTAAYRLQQKGFNNVTVYEAKKRVGGRVFTIHMKDYLGHTTNIELGGQTITDGGEAAYLTNLVEELNLEMDQKEVPISGLMYKDGQYQDFTQALKAFSKDFPDVMSTIDTLAAQSKTMEELFQALFKDQTALREAITTRIVAYEGVPLELQSVYHNLDTFKYMIQGGAAKAHEELDHKDNYIVLKTLKEGNAILPLKLAEKLGHKVCLNKALVKIKQKDNTFELFFKDGSSATYDFVVLTIPAPVYEDIDFTEAAFPQERLHKIQQITYGANCKVAYPRNLQNKNSYRFLLTKEMMCFLNWEDTVPILYMHHPMESTDYARLMHIVQKGLHLQDESHLSDLTLAQDIQYTTYTSAVTYPWSKDPYTQGSYAGYSIYMAEELDQKVIHKGIAFKKLFEPLHGRLLFAGEHTTLSEYIGTMEAAVESGERIAKYIAISSPK